MKHHITNVLAFLALAIGTSIECRHGSSFGSSFGGSLLGSTVGSAIGTSIASRPSEVYVEREVTRRPRVSGEIARLEDEIDRLSEIISELKNENRKLRMMVQKLKKQLRQMQENAGRKTGGKYLYKASETPEPEEKTNTYEEEQNGEY